MTPRRLWKLRLGVLELLSQGWATGQLVEKLLGHLTFASLLRRELLSCFQATCFCQKVLSCSFTFVASSCARVEMGMFTLATCVTQHGCRMEPAGPRH